jgi:hypothetical protein
MAIMVIDYLDYNDKGGYGRRCCHFKPKTKGYPVLKTHLHLNQSILQDEGLLSIRDPNTDDLGWNTNNLRTGTSFNLGNHGILVVFQRVKGSLTVVME